MLFIDDKHVRITKQCIRVGEFMKSGEQGYNINIQLLFVNIDTDEDGYINLDFGFEKDNNFNVFLNREYIGKPFDEDDNQFIYFEIFDTENFLDTEIEGQIVITLGSIVDDKIEASFELDDELIKVKFDGYLDMDFENTKETFMS